MKKKLCLAVLLVATNSYAADDDAKQAKNEWQNTSISEATIAKIQAAKFEYKKCVSDEMQKSDYAKQESRQATEVIIKQCESVLTKMRDVYLAEKVPEVIADRHLKQMRLQTTRDVLQNMMYGEAARSSGQSK